LVVVPAAQRVVADNCHSDFLCLSTVQRRVRAAVLLDGRAPGLQDAVGQQHGFAVPVLGPGDRRPGFRGDASIRAPDARHNFRRIYGHFTTHRSCLYEGVRGRPGPTV